jgi:hypothetical protein
MTGSVSAVACMRLLGRDADGDDAERAPLMTRQPRRDPLNLTTPRTLRATLFSRETRPKTFSSRLRQKSGLTPRITRRPAPLKVYDNSRAGGRVHALVRPRLGFEITRSAPHPLTASDDTTR